MGSNFPYQFKETEASVFTPKNRQESSNKIELKSIKSVDNEVMDYDTIDLNVKVSMSTPALD